jgi:cytochrome P450/NADPH-cytochrome P450 reductase
MLTFFTYEVLKHPEVLLKLRAEIDEVLGGRPVSLEDLPRMPYMVAVVRETLRIWNPAPARFVFPAEATTIGNGKYVVTPEDTIAINIMQAHRDPEVWGDDVCFFCFLFLVCMDSNGCARYTYSNPSECWMGSSRHCQ